jgi:hypothetical protein
MDQEDDIRHNGTDTSQAQIRQRGTVSLRQDKPVSQQRPRVSWDVQMSLCIAHCHFEKIKPRQKDQEWSSIPPTLPKEATLSQIRF